LSAAVGAAAPIAARNSVEITETGQLTTPESQGLLNNPNTVNAVVKFMAHPASGNKHVLNVIEIHKDAWVSHLTAPAAPDCAKVRPYFPRNLSEKATYNVLDTLARTVPGLLVDWMNANQFVQRKQTFREFYALNANYFNFPDPQPFPDHKYDNRTGKVPESCVKPAGPSGDPAKVELKDQLPRLEDSIDAQFPPSPLILFNDGSGLRLNAYHHGAPPADRGTKWQQDYVAAVKASHGAAIVSGISLVYPVGKVPQEGDLGTNGTNRIPRIALAWNGTHAEYPLAIISWHTALSAPQDGKLATGPTLMELAEVVRALGYTEALNLDGSGSSQLIHGGAEASKGLRAMIPLNIDNKYAYDIDQKPFAVPRPVPNGLLFYELQQKQ
jgi:hypothetical protein